jgi:hypothetical protein
VEEAERGEDGFCGYERHGCGCWVLLGWVLVMSRSSGCHRVRLTSAFDEYVWVAEETGG